MSENRFSIWHIVGLVAVTLSIAALSLSGGVFLGYQWGRASGLAAAVSARAESRTVPVPNPRTQLPHGLDPFLTGVARPFLGIEFEMVTPELAKTEKLDVTEGALIRSVVADSPADQAGLRPGDVILKVDDQPVAAASTLRGLIQTHEPGDTVTLSVWRAGQTADYTVTLGSSAEIPNWPIQATPTEPSS